jgi:hypothetical protein
MSWAIGAPATKARAEMRSMAAHFDAEIEALQHELESRPGSTGLMDGA